MAKVRLDVGAEVDFLNKDEMGDLLSDHARNQATARERERLSGVKYIRAPRMVGSQTSGTVALGTAPPWVGPAQGYAWSVRRISASGLGTGNSPDILNIYRNGTQFDPVWQLNGNSFAYTFGKGEFVLLAGENIQCLSQGSMTSTTPVLFNMDVVEVPSEFLGKLVS